MPFDKNFFDNKKLSLWISHELVIEKNLHPQSKDRLCDMFKIASYTRYGDKFYISLLYGVEMIA